MRLIYVKDAGVFGIVLQRFGIDGTTIQAKWYLDGFLHIEILDEDDYIAYGLMVE